MTDTKNQIIFQGKPHWCGSCSDWCRKTRWLITGTYIEREQGLCCPHIDNLQLLRVKDIAYKQECCCCGCCGTITVYSSDETTPELQIRGVPNGKRVYQQIRDAVGRLHNNAKLEIDV